MRAGDDYNSLHDKPNDEVALLVGMERLDQLFNIYYLLTSHNLESKSLYYKGIFRRVTTSIVYLQELVSKSSLKASWAKFKNRK